MIRHNGDFDSALDALVTGENQNIQTNEETQTAQIKTATAQDVAPAVALDIDMQQYNRPLSFDYLETMI